MAITKEKKQDLVAQYVADLKSAKNLILVKQTGIQVSSDASIRKEVREQDGKFNVVRKKLFLRALNEAGYPEIDSSLMPGAVVAVYAKGDEYAPLKVINKFSKEFKKQKGVNSSFEFLGGWFDKEWKDGNYVDALANVPSKEESLSKLVWLLNYPVQHFAATVKAVAEKKGE